VRPDGEAEESPRRRSAAVLAAAATLYLLLVAPRTEGRDFSTYYAAGEMARAGEAAAAFDRPTLMAHYAERHGNKSAIGGFLYSPLYLAPAVAFARLPERDAERLNLTLSVLAFGAGLALVLARVGSLALRALVSVAFVACHAVAATLVFLNWTSWLFLGLALALAARAAGRPWGAALAWGLVCHLKVFFAAVPAALALAGERRAAWRAALLAALLAVATLPFVGWTSYLAWARALREAGRLGVLPLFNAISLPAATARFLVPPWRWLASPDGVVSAWVTAAEVAAAALALCAVWRNRRDAERCAGAALAGLLLVVPLAWDHLTVLLFLLIPSLPKRGAAALAVGLASTHGYQWLSGLALRQSFSQAWSPVAGALALSCYPLAISALLVGLALFPGTAPSAGDTAVEHA
jgi:hypothetical protein